MFNLLMFSVEWTSGRITVPKSRMFEYTEDHIIAQFKDDSGKILLDRLTALPCLFCDEGITDKRAYIGHINHAEISGLDVLLNVCIDDDVPTLLNSIIYENRTDLNVVNEWEFSRNHWAVKNKDLYSFLFHHCLPHRPCPIVFKISKHEDIQVNLASAMMPFNAEFNPVYDSICQAAKNVGLTCARADDIWENNTIIQDVIDLIDRSRIIICDCSGKNPNVFYETGIAHTLGRDVILIAQSKHDIPFDLRHIRYLSYHNNNEGRIELIKGLQERMQTLLKS